MNIYLISQNVNQDYDTYDKAVVVAGSVEEARKIHPNPRYKVVGDANWVYISGGFTNEKPSKTTDDWCAISEVVVTFIGTTDLYEEGTIICSSFNAS